MMRPDPVAVLIEDEAQIRRFVRGALEEEGWRVIEADTLKQGLVEAGTRKPDMLIVDLGLPDGDGLDLIREVRAWSDVPLIVLSARSEEQSKISALDLGADDYLTKPFGVGELLARVRAARRRGFIGKEAGSVVTFGEVAIDLSRRIVTRHGDVVHLTPIEYRLLALLVANAGKVLTYRHICREVWGPTHEHDAHYARVCMGHLRRKLEDEPALPKFITTETGIGYRLALP